MSSRYFKRKFLESKKSLDETIQRILAINRMRKSGTKVRGEAAPADIAEELKVLNATADIQARVVKRYQRALEDSPERA